MSQKSSLLQPANSVSQVLIPDRDAGARRGGDGDRAAARHCDEFAVHVAAAGSPGDCRFGGTAACPGSAHRGCGRKRPIDRSPGGDAAPEAPGLIEIELGDGKRVSVDENVDAEALGRVLDVLSRR